MVTCYAMTSALMCAKKPLLYACNRVMMLENGILPRMHACLKLRDDPGNFRSRHSPLCEDTLIAQIEGRAMHLQLFILLLGFWSNPIIEKGFCVLAMVNNPPELGVSLARSSFRARAPGASERSFSDR